MIIISSLSKKILSGEENETGTVAPLDEHVVVGVCKIVSVHVDFLVYVHQMHSTVFLYRTLSLTNVCGHKGK